MENGGSVSHVDPSYTRSIMIVRMIMLASEVSRMNRQKKEQLLPS